MRLHAVGSEGRSIPEWQEQCKHSEEKRMRLANHPLVGAAIQLAFESLGGELAILKSSAAGPHAGLPIDQ